MIHRAVRPIQSKDGRSELVVYPECFKAYTAQIAPHTNTHEQLVCILVAACDSWVKGSKKNQR